MLKKDYSTLQMITPQAIQTTVIMDGQTRLWFQRLLSVPHVKQRLTASDANNRRLYQKHHSLSLCAAGLLGLSLLFIVLLRSSPPQPWWLHPCLLIVPLSGALLCAQHKDKALAQIAANLIEQDQELWSKGKTLYQMGEDYARRTNIPSIIDTIWAWDLHLRNAYLYSYLAGIGIYFLSFKDIILFSTAVCILSLICVHIVTLSHFSKYKPT